MCLTLLTALIVTFAVAEGRRPVSEVHGPVQVLNVLDGDTLVLGSDLGPRTVRLIGIDTPEMGEGAPALVAREQLIGAIPPGTQVMVELGRETTDRYGRLLAYLYVEDPNGAWEVAGRRAMQVNLAMVEGGWAQTLTIPPNDDYAHLYAAAMSDAASRGLGLWGGGGAQLDALDEAPVRLHCALVNPSTPNDEGAEWVSVWLEGATDTTGYYLWDEGSKSTFRLPSGVQPAGEIRIVNPGQGVWNNSGDTIYLMLGGAVIDRWTYGKELAVSDRVACR